MEGSRYNEIHWHEDALAYAEEFGLTREDCEKIMLAKSNPTLDSRSHEVGHLIVRYRAGDVVVVVGHRDLEDPVIMSVWVDTHQETKGGGTKPGGSGSSLPKTQKELIKRILGHGFKIKHDNRGHLKVVDENGVFVYSLPSTPSEYRSIANAWSGYNRARAKYNKEKRERGREQEA